MNPGILVSKVSRIAETSDTAGINISGQGMDRVIEKRIPRGRLAGYAVAALAAIAFVVWFVSFLAAGRSLSVNAQRVTVSTVSTGTFEDFIPLRGRLVPRSTVYLDAIEGGRVESVLVEDGAIVAAGVCVRRRTTPRPAACS